MTISMNSLDWFYYPMILPVTEDGDGPAIIGDDAAKLVYEVWDQELTSHGSFDTLYQAINKAMELEAKRINSDE